MIKNLEAADTIVKLALATATIALYVSGAIAGRFALALVVLSVLVLLIYVLRGISKRRRRDVMVLTALVTVFGSCYRYAIPDLYYAQDSVPAVPLIMPGNPGDSLYAGLRNQAAVVDFYRTIDWDPAWVGSEETVVLVDSLVAFISKIRHYGLLPQHYHFDELVQHDRLWWRPERMLRRDILLTDAFLSVATDLRSGRLSGRLNDSLAISTLRKALADGRISERLEEQQPAYRQYRDLRQALEKLIGRADSSVRSQLMQGHVVDSIPVHRQVQIVELNLERWRQEKGFSASRYVYVNIPSFQLEVIDGDTVVLESRAIVGKPSQATPEFNSTIQCFVTYPYWHVPRRIAVEEFLPAIQRDTSFITRNNFDVLDRGGRVLHPDSIAWKQFNRNNFPILLRQREGPDNSMGILKFVFDNPYAVFVHDTNAPRLFRLKSRALSHGCIRIEKAELFAHYLVTGSVSKKSALLENYLAQRLMHTVDIPRPIPIYIRYLTAAADTKGDIVFYDDIYKKDSGLISKLYSTARVVTVKPPRPFPPAR